MTVSNESEKHALRRFYERLRDNVKLERGKSSLVENSVLITLLKTQSATRYRLISKSKLAAIDVAGDALSSLLGKGFVQSTGDFDSYIMTAKGVWKFECELRILNEDKLFSYLNDNYFTTGNLLTKDKTELNDKERVILLTMIAARAFSEASAVDLKMGDVARDKWKEILCCSFILLKEMGFLQNTKKTSFGDNEGNEHFVISLFRHNTKMLQKTQAIYRYTGEYVYYLDLFRNGALSTEKLSYLFWKIFQGNITQQQIDRITQFCNEVASKEQIFLFDMTKHKFGLPNYDRIIKNCLLDSIMSKEKWSRVT